MSNEIRSVAMLAANPAFAAILSRALEQEGGYSVASFTGVETLTTFLRTSPVDAVILDCDLPGSPAVDIVRGLRNHVRLASDTFAAVALTRTAPAFHRPLLAAGIDAVLQKPVVPAQLMATLDRLLVAQRAVAASAHRAVERQARHAFPLRPMEHGGNVIPLFGEGRGSR